MKNILFAFVLFSNAIFAQEIVKKEKKAFTVGVKLMPGIAKIYGRANISQYTRFSMNGGIDFTKNLNNKFSIQSGLFLLNRGFGGNIDFIDEQGNTIKAKVAENFYYLQLPLILNFKKGIFYIGGGPVINHYIARRYIYQQELLTTEKLPYLSDYLFGAIFQIGLLKDLSPKIALDLDIHLNPTLNENFINYGLGVGLKYKII